MNTESITLPFRPKIYPRSPTIGQYFFLFLVGLIISRFCFTISQAIVYPKSSSDIYVVRVTGQDAFRILLQIPLSTYWATVQSSFGAGIREELVYRFLLMRVICIDLLRLPIWASIQISALFFGMCHIGNVPSFRNNEEIMAVMRQIVGAYIIGIFDGFLYMYTNNIVFLMIIHGMYDTIINIMGIIVSQYIQEQTDEK